MAEGIFRQAVRARGDYRVLSAGLGAAEGQPPSAYAVQAVKELGIDISGTEDGTQVRRNITIYADIQMAAERGHKCFSFDVHGADFRHNISIVWTHIQYDQPEPVYNPAECCNRFRTATGTNNAINLP